MKELSATVSFLVSEEIKARLVAQAKRERRSQAMIGRIALEEYLDRNAPEKPPVGIPEKPPVREWLEV